MVKANGLAAFLLQHALELPVPLTLPFEGTYMCMFFFVHQERKEGAVQGPGSEQKLQAEAQQLDSHLLAERVSPRPGFLDLRLTPPRSHWAVGRMNRIRG